MVALSSGVLSYLLSHVLPESVPSSEATKYFRQEFLLASIALGKGVSKQLHYALSGGAKVNVVHQKEVRVTTVYPATLLDDKPLIFLMDQD